MFHVLGKFIFVNCRYRHNTIWTGHST